jgi:hypothetical protein
LVHRALSYEGEADFLAATVPFVQEGLEPIGSGRLEIGARFLAFCLVIAGAALMPAPMRAAPDAVRTPSPATSQSDLA